MSTPMPVPAAAPNELVFTRIIDAPRELVFAAWTSPDHLPHWYGPRGFQTTVHAMDVRPGGTAKLTMRGPDGATYPNNLVYDEVDAPARLVYTNRGSREDGGDPTHHQHVITFEPAGDRGERTRLTMRLVFPTAEARDFTARTYGAEEGGKQTMERLAAFVADLGFVVDPQKPIVTLTRVFDAPAHLLFAALVSPQHIARWWGPRGSLLSTCDFTARSGADYRFVLRAADGSEHPFTGTVKEVSPPLRLVMTQRYDVPAFRPFTSTVTCALSPMGERTLLTVTEAFANLAERDGKVNSGMRGGAVESHERLGELMDELVVRGKDLHIERTFDAPRALLWEAFTKPEHVKRWLAPPPLTLPVFECDLRPGGAIEMVMRTPDGIEFPSTGTVREVVVGERYAWTGKIHDSIEVESVIRFVDAPGGKTTLIVDQHYSHVGPPTMGAKMGWQGSLDALTALVRDLQAA